MSRSETIHAEPEASYRQPLRLAHYDYAQQGAYFVTVCARDRVCLFGEVIDGAVRLNEAGHLVQAAWNEVPGRFPRVGLDAFVVMPNHVHGIVVFTGARLALPAHRGTPERGASVGAGLAPPGDQGAGVGAGLALPGDQGAASSAPTLGDVMRAFKSVSALYVNRQLGRGASLWQRYYYDHIIRDEPDLLRIQVYIEGNPAKWEDDHENPARKRQEPGRASRGRACPAR